jgi:hypothetical protein
MKNILILSAMLLALGALSGNPSNSAPVMPQDAVFSPSSIPVSPNLPIESYPAI